MIKKSIFWINRLLWTLLVGALILLASYASIGRYYSDYIEQYQEQLLAQLTTLSGLSISADRLYGGWHRLSPVLTVESLQLAENVEGAAALLHIDLIRFHIDPWRSLRLRSLQVSRLYIEGVKAGIEEYAPRQWRLQSYSASGSGADFDSSIDLLLAVESIELHDLQLALAFYDGEHSQLEAYELSLQHQGGFRRLRLLLGLSPEVAPITALIEANGDPRERDNFSARAYLQLQDLDFYSQLPVLRSFGIALTDAQVDGRLWAEWRRGGALSLQGEIATPLIDLAGLSGDAIAPVENLAFSFRAEQSADKNWQAWIRGLQLDWQQQRFAFDTLQLSLPAAAENARLELRLPQLDSAAISEKFALMPQLSEQLRELLTTLSPAGFLRNIRLQIPLGEAPDAGFLLDANLSDISLSPWKGAPGASGVSGYLQLAPSEGQVLLDSRALALSFLSVYQQPLHFDSARAALRWRIDKQHFQLRSGVIETQAEHGVASALLALDLPRHPSSNELDKRGDEAPDNGEQAEPEMTLVVGLRDSDAAYRQRFIPYTLSASLLDWLERSIQAGAVSDGGFIFRGSLRREASEQRTVQLYLNTAQAQLDYHPDWPPLSQAEALLSLDNTELTVALRSALISGLAVERGDIQLSSDAEGLWLTVEAAASGGADDGLALLTQSQGIRRVTGSIFDSWQMQGGLRTELALRVPLGAPDQALPGAHREARIAVDTQLDEVALTLAEQRLQIEKIHGPLHYHSERGLYSERLHGELFGQPLFLSARSNEQGAVLLDITGNAAVRDIEQWLQQPALSFLDGQSEFHALLVAGREHSQLSLSSDLEGVTIDAPAPFAKNASLRRRLSVDVPLGRADSRLVVAMPELFRLELDFLQSRLDSAQLYLGAVDERSLSPLAGNLQVGGHLPQLDWEQWQASFRRYLQASQHWPQSGEALQPLVSGLQVDQLRAFGRQQADVMLNAQRRDSGWLLAAGNSVFAGEFFFPDSATEPLAIHFKHLHLDSAIWSEGADIAQPSQRAELETRFDPRSVFKADVSIANLSLDGEAWGDIAAKLRPDERGLAVEQLYGHLRGIGLGSAQQPMSARWDLRAGCDYSEFRGQLHFDNLGKVLARWGYEPIIETRKGVVQVELAWPGNPQQWQLLNSQGSAVVNLEQGRFLKTSGAASGALKVVGILNFTNILRRIQLDFSDIFKEGVSFDALEGKFALADQRLSIVDQLRIESPSSRFRIRGSSDLQQRLLDMELIATLPIASNLPWVVALAGGLPAAATAYVASKVFKKQVDKFSSAVYSLDGSWDDPQLTFKQIFNDEISRAAPTGAEADAAAGNPVLDSGF